MIQCRKGGKGFPPFIDAEWGSGGRRFKSGRPDTNTSSKSPRYAQQSPTLLQFVNKNVSKMSSAPNSLQMMQNNESYFSV